MVWLALHSSLRVEYIKETVSFMFEVVQNFVFKALYKHEGIDLVILLMIQPFLVDKCTNAFRL